MPLDIYFSGNEKGTSIFGMKLPLPYVSLEGSF